MTLTDPAWKGQHPIYLWVIWGKVARGVSSEIGNNSLPRSAKPQGTGRGTHTFKLPTQNSHILRELYIHDLAGRCGRIQTHVHPEAQNASCVQQTLSGQLPACSSRTGPDSSCGHQQPAQSQFSSRAHSPGETIASGWNGHPTSGSLPLLLGLFPGRLPLLWSL